MFGDFTGGLERDGKDHKTWALKSFAESVNFPIWSGVKAGHNEVNYPLPIGGKVKLSNNKMTVFYGNNK